MCSNLSVEQLAVEVDGYWHTRETQITRDRARDAELLSKGWQTLRITDKDVFAHPDDCVQRIRDALSAV